MLPREHGAYAEILLPLAAVLLVGEVGPAALLLALAAVCGFVAHEPISILLGRRGERARVEDARRAGRWSAALALTIAISVAAVAWGGDATLRGALAVPAVFVLGSSLLVLTRRERTTGGQLLIAATLASAAIPTGVAAGLAPTTAVAVAAVWAVGSGLAAATVRGIVLAAKLTRSWEPEFAILAGVAALATAAALSVTPSAPAWFALALCPLALLSVAVGAFRPKPARLRQVGWSFVGANVLTLVIVVVGV